MIPLGLKSSELADLEAQMRGTARIRVRLTMLNLAGNEVSDLTDRLLDGQVNIDTTAETVRQLSCTLSDPDRSLALDSDSPDDGALYADRMLRATYGFYVDALGLWVDVPVFTGPLATFQRNGGSVQVSCLGKEHLAGGQAWRPMQFKQGHNVGDTIKSILRERAGESKFSFPNVKNRLPKGGYSLGRLTSPWVAAQQLAGGIGRQLYYDGAGVCRLRRPPGTTTFTFNGEVLLSDPDVTYDLSTVRNAVWVRGHKPKKKPQITATATASRNHPLSPWALGRNGEPRYLVEVVERDNVRSRKDARQLASRTLQGLLLEGVSCTFDALPIPHLDPLDVVALKTDEASIRFPLRQASLPLVHGGVMSVGALKRVTRPKRRSR